MKMNTIAFENGKATFQVFLIVLGQWASISCQLNLYNTDRPFKSSPLQYDCLNYHVYRETLAYQELSNLVDELIPFCFRPENNLKALSKTSASPFAQKLSFDEMRIADITVQQLLSWSISIEIVERYQIYLDTPTSLLNEDFFNCTPPRFGLQCQYSFAVGGGMSFNEIIEALFHGKITYPESSNTRVSVPCYILLSCHRYRQFWCLDWREICDGKIDCFDEGLDEKFCFDMEINECRDDEYRCHNGLCISKDLWEDGLGDTDCLDRSDRAIEMSYMDFCFQDPTFRCEEHSCRPNWKLFSCGDGQCVLKFEKCDNGRHVLLIDSMAAKGNLTHDCWMTMICLTKLIKKADEILCEIWLMSNASDAALEQCESFFQFPTIPIHSDHIRLFYKDVHLRSNDDEFLLPDYICYDQQRCDYIVAELVYKNLTCIKKPESMSVWDTTVNPWDPLVFFIEGYFHSCSTTHVMYDHKTNYNGNSSLYNCQNSSKLISKHRIMDRIQDCFKNDDETYNDSCLLNDRYRVKCHNTDKCWSPVVKNTACSLDNREEIPFENFCDGIARDLYDNNGEKYNDEVGCGEWSCNNIYARCDGFWSCSDGRDEDNCSRKICPSQHYACISSINYTKLCLPPELVNDETIQCLGELDKQVICRTSRFSKEVSYSFRCPVTRWCLSVSQLCDKHNDCLNGTDEFCKPQFECDEDSVHNRSHVEEIVCALREEENHRVKYFSLYTSSNYPLLETNDDTEFNHWSKEHFSIRHSNGSQLVNNSWPWFCHRGLVINIWNENNSSNLTCMRPPSYYGKFCQYQNQRTSLILKLASNERRATYVVVSMLVNDVDGMIDAYDKFTYITKESCSIKLHRYLLFSTRPKNISKNYNVRIDVFGKNTITYVGSWYFPITFLFLPVNRLAVSLNISSHLLQSSLECSISCKNGKCVKYVNTNKSFCRCYSQWSGVHCDISMNNCQSCSSKSICIGSSNNQSICVCPIDRFGARCELISTCSIDACQNNGLCVPHDISIPKNNYTCICSERFFGQHCEHQKVRLDITLGNIDIPLYLVAYFFTLSNKSDPIESVVLRKLTLFQHIVTFHVTIPFQLVFIQVNKKFYLAFLQQSPKTGIVTTISPKQECIPTEQLLNLTVLNLTKYQRIVHFHMLCQTQFSLTCFIDRDYICLCTKDHHANCIKFNRERNFQCLLNNYCVNKGQCLQDHPTCPSKQICLCPKCFFGDRCQFYAKGLGSTLDEILGYQFQRNTLLTKQPIPVKVATIVTVLIFMIGMINSILSITIFSRKQAQQVGCGIYLLGSSIAALFTMILFMLKVWFLFFSHQDYYGLENQRHIFQANCYVEPLLKLCLYLQNWLNACVAVERTISLRQGITFNTKLSKQMAVKIIILLLILIAGHFIPQLINLYIFYDEAEERSWCVVKYVSRVEMYITIMIFIHYCAPLIINLFAMFFVITITAHQKAITQTNRTQWGHIRLIIRKYRYTLMSCVVNVCLTLPYLTISIILDCNKSSKLLWFYLSGYFLSFLPISLNFIIYVLPSSHYMKEFTELILYIRRRYKIFKLNTLNIH